MNVENLEPVMKKYLEAVAVITENATAVKPAKDETTAMKAALLQAIHQMYTTDVAVFIDGLYLVKEHGQVQLKQVTDGVLLEICKSFKGQEAFESHFERCLSQIECAPKLSVKTARPKNLTIIYERISGSAEYLQAVENVAALQKPVDHVKKAKTKILNIILEFLIAHDLDVVHLGADYFLKETRTSKTKPTMVKAAATVWLACVNDMSQFPSLWRAAMTGEVTEESTVVKFVRDKLPVKYQHLLK